MAQFERIFQNALQNRNGKLLIIDEVGKMELLSEKFENTIRKIAQDKHTKFIATVPIASKNIQTVELLKNHNDAKIFHVTRSNRNELFEDFCQHAIALVRQ